MIEDSMDKLQQYGDELLEIASKHFPEVTRRLPKLERRDMGKVKNLKDVSQKRVRERRRPRKSIRTLKQNCEHFNRNSS